jgi:hypothetical protein
MAAMNHSLLTADRTTHLKIAGVAGAGAMLVIAWLGVLTADTSTTLARDNDGPAIKSRPAVSVTSNNASHVLH